MSLTDVSVSLPPQTGVLLAVDERGGLPENWHTGWAVVADVAGNVTWQTAEDAASHLALMRSAEKPFQAIPFLAAWQKNNLPLEMLAIACASHVATDVHVQWVDALLKEAGYETVAQMETALQCGVSYPVDTETRNQHIKAGIPQQRRFHNCSGKHAGMLYACHIHGWEAASYLDLDHPLQQAIHQNIQILLGLTHPIPTAWDGCGAPVCALPMQQSAQLFAKLGTERDLTALANAMATHPVLVGGENRVDSLLMKLSNGELLAKVGADGFIGVSHRTKGLGLTLKIADGDDQTRNKVVVHLLHQLGWLSSEIFYHPNLTTFREGLILNSQNREVGRTRFKLLVESVRKARE